MKKFFLFLFCFSLIFFVGCEKNDNKNPTADPAVFEAATTEDENIIIANKISEIESADSFDNETIKALSVVLRTNLTEDDFKNSSEEISNSKIYELVSSTSGEILTSENEPIYINIENEEETAWQKEIKKYKILEYMKENKISLSNISQIEPIKNEYGEVEKLFVGGKEITVSSLADYFELPSENIINIENKKQSVIVFGEGNKNDPNFNIKKSLKLAQKGDDYKKILKNGRNNFQIITKK